MSTPSIPAAEMQERLQNQTALPLLEDHFPVPVRLDGRWWHVPHQAQTGVADNAFVPASPAASDRYEQLLARRQAADGAVERRGSGTR